MVLAMINIATTSCTRHIAQECNVTHTTVKNILKKYKYHPYKYKCHQEIFGADEECRRAFCEDMQARINHGRNSLPSICITDECTFTLNNEPNVQNTSYWVQKNPWLNLNTRTQYPEKINIWAGIYNTSIIGPFKIEGNLKSHTYLDLLVNEIGPALEVAARDDQEIWFQHDGCPAHFSVNDEAMRHILFLLNLIRSQLAKVIVENVLQNQGCERNTADSEKQLMVTLWTLATTDS